MEAALKSTASTSLTMGKKKTYMAVFDAFDRLGFNENIEKSVTVLNIFESSSSLDQAESCSSIRLEMATVWSKHPHNLSIEGIQFF